MVMKKLYLSITIALGVLILTSTISIAQPVALTATPHSQQYPPGPPPSMQMPWDSSASYTFTSGPHNGVNQISCTQVSLSGATGLDFGMANKEVLSVADGHLQGQGSVGGDIGNRVIVDHGGGWSTQYWHLSSIDAAILTMPKGTHIPQGTLLGISGTAGTGAHLHLELRYNNSASGISWHGVTIGGYGVRAMTLQSDLSKILNYQGTLTKGKVSPNAIEYASCSNTPVTKWTNSSGTGTIEAGDGQKLPSSNLKKTILRVDVTLRDPTNASPINTNPRHPQRPIFVEVYNEKNQLVFRNNGRDVATYDASKDIYVAAVNLDSSWTSGSYQIKVRLDYSLRKSISGKASITKGTNTILPQTSLIAGDVNQDNVLNILDWNIILGCYSDLEPPKDCDPARKLASDINDDGNVNGGDTTLWQRIVSTNLGK